MYILSVRSVLFLLYYTTRICVFGGFIFLLFLSLTLLFFAHFA